MKAIILAAGYATRLYPLTKDQPKPLLPVGGKPILDHIVNKMEDIDYIDEIHIVTNNKFFENFNEWKKTYAGPKAIVVHNDGTMTNDDRLGAVGDIHFVIKQANIDEDVLVVGGDNLFEFSLKKLVDDFETHGNTLVAARDLKDKSELANKFGVIETDEGGVIASFEEKPAEPKSTLASTCIYLFNKTGVEELRDLVGDGETKVDNTGDLIRHLTDKHKVHCFNFDSKWFDIGSHEQLKEADDYLKGN